MHYKVVIIHERLYTTIIKSLLGRIEGCDFITSAKPSTCVKKSSLRRSNIVNTKNINKDISEIFQELQILHTAGVL